jgi:hypothetical protein
MIIGKAISPFAIKRRNGTVPNDADAQAFITASGISGTNATATNQLVIDLKAANIWTKMKAVYPMVGSSATSMKWNLVNPVDSNAAFRLTFAGGGTFSSNGYLPNGVNSYANTFCATNQMALNSIHLSYYSRSNVLAGESQISSTFTSSTPNSTSQINIKNAYIRLNQTGSITSVTNTNTLGLHIATRTASNLLKLNKNGNVIGTWTNITSATSTLPLYIAANNQNNSTINSYTTAECAFASIGDGLSDAEALAFYNAVQTFNTTLGRQV